MELTPVPPSLFYDDGSMRKTSKAELSKKIEANAEKIQALPTHKGKSAYVIDGMSLIQSMNEKLFKTFAQLAEGFFRRILIFFKVAQSVTLLFDRYDQDQTIKHQEQLRRGSTDTSPKYMISPERDVPNYRRFLKNRENKGNLTDFLSENLISSARVHLKENQYLVVGGGFKERERVMRVSRNQCEQLHHLESTHQEADTMIILHTIDYANLGYDQVIVRCDDTDVLILLLYYSQTSHINKNMKIFMHTGHRDKERFVPVHLISQKLGSIVCSILPAIHAITGCDSTSSIHMIGKNRAYTKMVNEKSHIKDLVNLGDDIHDSKFTDAARHFLLMMYGVKKNSKLISMTLDDYRFVIASTSNKSSSNLPPTENAFHQHILRCKVQVQIWVNSHVPKPSLWSPIGNGWYLQSGILTPVKITIPPAPDELRDMTHLYCRDSDCKITRKCPCLAAGMPCITICACFEGRCHNNSLDIDSNPIE